MNVSHHIEESETSRQFSELISGLMPGAIARANRLLRSQDDARDAVQESLLIGFSRLDQLRDPDCFPAWFNAIVDSQCQRHLRRRKREVFLEELERFEPLASKSLDPATSYEQRSFQAAAANAISQLSLPLRSVCQLYFDSGYSIEETADFLAIKKGTARKRLHAAQPLLAEILAEQMGEPCIRIGYLPISDHLLGMVAHRLAKGRRSRIQMKRFLSWSALSTALKRGVIDGAFIMAPLAMQLNNSGTPLKYIMDGHHDGSTLTFSGAKLQGKLVGVPGPYSTHRVLLGKMAQDYPGRWDNINVADTNPSYAISSLKKQVIDAFFCAEPWGSKCVSEGGADIAIQSKELAPGHLCCVVTVREDFCRDHADLVNDYVRVLLLARDKLHTDIQYCAETQALYTGVPSDIASQVLEEKVITFDDLHPDKSRMADFLQLALASRVLTQTCDLDEFVCTDFS